MGGAAADGGRGLRAGRRRARRALGRPAYPQKRLSRPALGHRAGEIELAIPKPRRGSYFPTFLEPRKRSEQALVAVVHEAYVAGGSTRKVDQVVESLGLRVSKSEVSRVCEGLDELKATGARPRTVLVSGADALTASERRVCQLAVEGLTNRGIAQALFVTLRTVETHLTSAYRKLEISSRRDLAGALGGGN